MTTPFDNRLDTAVDECLDDVGKAVIGLKTLKNSDKGQLSSLKFAVMVAKELTRACGRAVGRLMENVAQAVK